MADVIKVVDNGLGIITNMLSGSGTSPRYIEWGTGATDAEDDDVDTQTQGADESRTTGTMSRTNTGGTTNDTFQVVGTITCLTAAKGIQEATLFDASTAGTLFLRGTFDVINVNVDDSIEFTIRTTFDQA
tara:strand:+ start:217 stop:606 length:390 start_codon:yes stop_codon:yes gene_type:complete